MQNREDKRDRHAPASCPVHPACVAARLRHEPSKLIVTDVSIIYDSSKQQDKDTGRDYRTMALCKSGLKKRLFSR